MKSLTESKTPVASAEPHLIFGLRQSVFAIAASAVLEIHALPEMTELVEAPRGVAGVVNVRGMVVPVLDLQAVFALPSQMPAVDRTLIVVEAASEDRIFVFGIIVDEVRRVTSIGAREVSRLAALTSSTSTQSIDSAALPGGGNLVSHVARLQQELVMVLQAETLARVFDGILIPEYQNTPLAIEAEPGFEGDGPGPGALVAHSGSGSEIASHVEREILRRRAVELLRPSEAPDLTHLLAIALVELHGEFFGIELDVIREFCDIRNVTPVPCCPPHILGQMNLRGEILTLVDIRAILDMKVADSSPLNRVVVVEEGDVSLGIPVSDVLDVLYLQPAQINTLPAAARSAGGSGLKATAVHQERMVGLLDIGRILHEGGLLVDQDV